MAETHKITTLYVVTDTETGQEEIGDIDGGMFDDVWLESYIKRYGADKLYRRLAFMARQISNMEVSIWRQGDAKQN